MSREERMIVRRRFTRRKTRGVGERVAYGVLRKDTSWERGGLSREVVNGKAGSRSR